MVGEEKDRAKQDIENCTISREKRLILGKALSGTSVNLVEHSRGLS